MKALTRAALGLLCALQLALPTAAFAQTPPIDTAFGYIPQYALVFGARKSPGIEVTDARPLPTYCVSYLGSSCGGGGSATLAPFLSDGTPAVLALATPNTSGRIALPGGGQTVRITVSAGVAECKVGNTSVTALATDPAYAGGIRSGGVAANSQADIACISSVANVITVETGSGTAYPEIASDLTAAGAVKGTVAPGVADNGDAPVKDGGLCKTSDPTAQATGQIVETLHDCLGKVITVPVLRSQKNVQTTTITASASETTVLTAGSSGVFNDVYGVILDNTSATVAAHCDFKDATSGTTRFSLDAPTSTTTTSGTAGFTVDAGSAIPQASAANNWTATCTSLTSEKITVLYVATKG